VLLVEAGPDYSTLSELPDDIADASQPTLSHDSRCVSQRDQHLDDATGVIEADPAEVDQPLSARS
jgi:hypothetical protein